MERGDRGGTRTQLGARDLVDQAVRGFLTFFQEIYSGAPEELRWTDGDDTRILITQSQETDPSKLPKLPALCVSYSDARWLWPVRKPMKKLVHGTDSTTVSQVIFNLVARVFSKDDTEAHDLGFQIFDLTPTFGEMLATMSGITPFGSPVIQPRPIRSADGVTYYMNQLFLPCAVRVQTAKAMGEDSVYARTLTRVRTTMQVELGTPPQSGGAVDDGTILMRLPMDMLDVVLQRGQFGLVDVAPADAPAPDGVPLDVQADLTEDSNG